MFFDLSLNIYLGIITIPFVTHFSFVTHFYYRGFGAFLYTWILENHYVTPSKREIYTLFDCLKIAYCTIFEDGSKIIQGIPFVTHFSFVTHFYYRGFWTFPYTWILENTRIYRTCDHLIDLPYVWKPTIWTNPYVRTIYITLENSV